MRVEVLDGAPGEVRFRTDRGVHTLAPVVANNITVEPVPVAVRADGDTLTLADARPGESVRVLSVSTAYAEAPRRRLLDLGVVPGTVIRAEFRGAAGGPMAYRVRDALIALRAEQAAHIDVERVAASDEARADEHAGAGTGR
jgi:Fe2+ transport system protein FeoA